MRKLHPGANLHRVQNCTPLLRVYINRVHPRFYLKFEFYGWNVLSDRNSLSLCEHACARACVCGGGFLDISIAGVRLKRLHSFHIQAIPEKHTINI